MLLYYGLSLSALVDARGRGEGFLGRAIVRTKIILIGSVESFGFDD